MSVNYTSIVYNHPSKIVGLAPFYYRWRSCDTNLTSNTPANRYQIQKRIQNTVRVYSSLYTDNKAALSAYKRPGPETHGVCWNQQSDRPIPSVQKASVPTEYGQSLINNRHHSVTSGRPGCQTPGGVGCDIKHNSYARYLNRLKGRGPLRRGPIPKTFASPTIPFNCGYPVYGSKLMKSNIVTGCDCPIIKDKLTQNMNVYNNPLYQPIEETSEYIFKVGDNVMRFDNNTSEFVDGVITAVNGDGTYDMLTSNNKVLTNVSGYALIPTYKKCLPDPCNSDNTTSLSAEDIESLLDPNYQSSGQPNITSL